MRLETDDEINISKNVLMSIISPLLENAVTAAPIDSEIKLNISKTATTINIKLENECTEVPILSNLQKVGYSSKDAHIGTGLETVRHFLVLLGGSELEMSLNDSTIIFSFQVPLK